MLRKLLFDMYYLPVVRLVRPSLSLHRLYAWSATVKTNELCEWTLYIWCFSSQLMLHNYAKWVIIV